MMFVFQYNGDRIWRETGLCHEAKPRAVIVVEEDTPSVRSGQTQEFLGLKAYGLRPGVYGIMGLRVSET